MRGHRTTRGGELGRAGTGTVAAWDRLTAEILSHGRGAAAALSDLLAADPTPSAAHAVRGLMLLSLARAELVVEAHAALAEARRLARAEPALISRAAYADALALWLDGKPLAAAAALDAGLERHPADVLAFKFAHGIRFMAGDLAGMRDAARRAAAGFGGMPFHGFVLGCAAFAEEEAGDIAAAERLARRSVELSPRDAWGRHALAHVFEMTGRALEGARWLRSAAGDWAHCNNFSYHMFWHLALFELELGRTDAVLDLYDREIRAERTDDYRDIANGASLLARLEIEGVDVGGRWDELADIASRRAAERSLVFADLHYLLALTGAGRDAEAAALVGALGTDARRGGHDARVARRVGLSVAMALASFRAGDYADAADLFQDALPRLSMIGGSHAQRDLFEQLAIEASARSGDLVRASALLERRLRRRGGRNRFAGERLAALAGRSRGEDRGLRFASLAVASTAPALNH
jgi:hypothetical protein